MASSSWPSRKDLAAVSDFPLPLRSQPKGEAPTPNRSPGAAKAAACSPTDELKAEKNFPLGTNKVYLN